MTAKKRRSNRRVLMDVLTSNTDVFGPWVPLIAAMASKTEAVSADKRTEMAVRLERSFRDLCTAPVPSLESWRDLTDVVNFLQSLQELGWAEDPDQQVAYSKGALEQAVRAYENEGRLRLDDVSRAQLRSCLNQFEELVRAISAHSFWIAVRATKTRVFTVLRGGARQAGDVVVAV